MRLPLPAPAAVPLARSSLQKVPTACSRRGASLAAAPASQPAPPRVASEPTIMFPNTRNTPLCIIAAQSFDPVTRTAAIMYTGTGEAETLRMDDIVKEGHMSLLLHQPGQR